MDEKALTVVMPQQRAKTLDMRRCNSPSVTLGLDEVFLVADDNLTVQATITAIGGIADNRIPLTLERQEQQLFKDVGIDFAQVHQALTIATQLRQSLQNAGGRCTVTPVAPCGGRLTATQVERGHHHNKQPDKQDSQQWTRHQCCTEMPRRHHGVTCWDRPVSVMSTG